MQILLSSLISPRRKQGQVIEQQTHVLREVASHSPPYSRRNLNPIWNIPDFFRSDLEIQKSDIKGKHFLIKSGIQK